MNKKEKNEEIWELINIPEVAKFLSSALAEAKEKFKDQIQQYREAKNKLKEEKKQEVIPPGLNELSTDKSYFFDIIRIEDTESDKGYRWVVEKFKFKDKPDIVNFIFSDFIKKIDQLKIDPQHIKTQDVHSSTGRSFKINFTKSSDTHVGGFVKTIAPQEVKERMEDSKVIKLSREYEGMDDEEMYQKIIQLMRENPEVREDIFFYYHMAQKSKK